MTDDEILRLAAGEYHFDLHETATHGTQIADSGNVWITQSIIGLARAVEAAAYERAARVCEQVGFTRLQMMHVQERDAAQSCARAIRALRGAGEGE